MTYYKKDREKRTNYRRNRRHKLIRYYKDKAGGKCYLCGYSQNYAALEFHHKDPKKKSFSIRKQEIERKKSVVEDEIKKCVLLCKNCHTDITYPNLSTNLEKTKGIYTLPGYTYNTVTPYLSSLLVSVS